VIILPGPEVARYSNAIISIDGLLLGLELDGVRWKYTNLTGWGMGGAVDTNFTPRPGQHGMHDGPMYRRERVITVEGLLRAPTRALAKQAERALAACLADGTLGTFAVDDPDLGWEQAQVKLSAPPQSSGVAAGVGVIAWQLQFTAPDHRKYGDLDSASTPLPGGGTGIAFPLGAPFSFGTPPATGSVVFTNTGTAPTEPILTVSGPLGVGFQAVHVETGRRLRYEAPVVDEVVIDCREGTATSGGQDRTGLLTADDFFTVDPGATATFQWSTLGSETSADPPSMTVAVAPANH
jgi:hypothetical protein